MRTGQSAPIRFLPQESHPCDSEGNPPSLTRGDPRIPCTSTYVPERIVHALRAPDKCFGARNPRFTCLTEAVSQLDRWRCRRAYQEKDRVATAIPPRTRDPRSPCT